MAADAHTAEKSLAVATNIGRGALPGTLARLLELTYDGVVVFDSAGRVLMANEVARRLLELPEAGTGKLCSLVGRLRPSGQRGRFVDDAISEDGATGAGTLQSEDAIARFELPCACDGSSVVLDVLNPNDPTAGRTALRRVVVRCDAVSAPGITYLMVVHEMGLQSSVEATHADQLVRELTEANHRLSGTLNIVLETLDSDDVETLFVRVLEELTATMEAFGCALWIAESRGFRLAGSSKSLQNVALASYLPQTGGIVQRTVAAGHALRLQVEAPEAYDLRKATGLRNVIDEETNERLRIPQKDLPPFLSFIVVPVWFGSHVIALIQVGWDRMHPLKRNDARLLDAVAQYLSVQLMGAMTALQAAHDEALTNLALQLREELDSMDPITWTHVREVLAAISSELQCSFVPLGINERAGSLTAVLPPNLATPGSSSPSVGVAAHSISTADKNVLMLPFVLDSTLSAYWEDDVAVAPLANTDLGDVLLSAGLSDNGLVVHMGTLDGAPRAYLVVRPLDAEPLEAADIAFFHELSDIVRERFAANASRVQDKHIAQALQSGMKNELQQVEGIRAAGMYSSATADAFVGGDFYDLIRLPDHKACVIMGDVSGKGVEAASVSAAVKTALGAYAWQQIPPAHMVSMLNNFLLGFSRLETFATLFVGVIDLKAATMTYCSAGHPPALLLRREGAALEALDVQSGVVGAFEGMQYRDGSVKLNPHDMLLLYTDGTTEARDPKGVFFGERGLREAALREARVGFDGILERLLGVLDSFTEHKLEDDLAMVALEFTQLGAGARRGTNSQSA